MKPKTNKEQPSQQLFPTSRYLKPRVHVAIMKREWGLIPKILNRQKTVETRWYKTRHAPWNRIAAGETIFFKDSGMPVTVRARVSKVLQFEGLNAQKVHEILDIWGKADTGLNKSDPFLTEYARGKNYCILVFIEQVRQVRPFEIDKSGFGSQCAWIITDDIHKIKRT